MEESVKERLKRLGISPSRSLGQNFLRDRRVAERQVEAADVRPSDKVLEIGPGLGVLTDELVKRAGKTIAVEKDPALTGYLEGRYKDKNFELLEGDVLQMDLPEFDKIVSNIPFSISSPLTFKLLKEEFELGVLMYQKEYAERLTAGKDDDGYSRLSVMTSILADVDHLFDVSPKRFYPPPDVEVSVVRLSPGKPGFDLRHPEAFSEVVRELFNYRRKKIKNSLEYGFDIRGIDDIPFLDKRVEDLSPEEISELVDHLVERDLLPDFN